MEMKGFGKWASEKATIVGDHALRALKKQSQIRRGEKREFVCDSNPGPTREKKLA